MKIAIEFQNLKLRVPESKNDLPVNVIVGGDGGGGPEPGPSGSFIRQLFVTNIIQSTSSIFGHGEVVE